VVGGVAVVGGAGGAGGVAVAGDAGVVVGTTGDAAGGGGAGFPQRPSVMLIDTVRAPGSLVTSRWLAPGGETIRPPSTRLQ
jgi:hypothetical protein